MDNTDTQTRIWQDEALGFTVLRARFKEQTFAKHVHSGYCIGLVEAGAHGFYCKGGNHVGAPGSIILVNADEVHTGHNAADKTRAPLWSYHAMYPEPEQVGMALEQHLGRTADLPAFIKPVARDRHSAIMLAALFRSLNHRESRLARQCQFVQVIACLAARHSRSRNVAALGDEHPKVEVIKQRLHDQLADDVSLDTLARDIGWSSSYLVRAFKKRVGMPPHAFQIQLRVECARQALQRGEKVSQAAFVAGFSDQSHLHRHFVKTLGVTPGAYRRACMG